MEVITGKKLKIAIQGYEGSFHQEAAQKHYPEHIEIVPMSTFNQLIVNTQNGNANEGVMAIENSIAGSILPNYALLEQSELHIVGEVYIKIEQHLMALPGTKLSHIREVHSHPMALLQCADFLKQHPRMRLIETADTALSAKNIAEIRDHSIAAIASSTAANLYELEIIERNIETVSNNYTRFLILSTTPIQLHDANKASVRFTLPHRPGSLSNVMQVITGHHINISKIQSIPHVVTEWEYSFHLDLEFDSMEQFESLKTALATLCTGLRVLGIYKNGRK
ncbi:chorismate mutase [Fulvivirga sp. RKSG066]|uniref:prephenate dehydratase n=1 Tax=Fulvivirga aurantia TaxID=2529383 RepID=UPI0012BBD1C1|nr:prephenate dehydratase [Fulvivirga aurantia]MTI22111.1 chorismate mutase [Fulvivirga aurantia]